MARKRGKLKGKAKAAFLRRMARGRRKAGLKVSVKINGRKKLRRKAKPNPIYGPVRHAPAKGKKDKRTKHEKRVAAARKGARTRARNKNRKSLARRGGRHVVHHRKSGGKSKLYRRYSRKVRSLAKRRPRSSGPRARLAVFRARKHSYAPGVSAKARHYLKLHGLTKVNGGAAGLRASLKALPGVLPEVLVAVGSAGAFTYLGGMVGKKIVNKMGANYAPYAAPAVSFLWGVLGFLGLRMSSKTSRFSVPVLTGGIFGAAVHVLAENHVAAVGEAPALSWGRALDLPIGSVVMRSEFSGFNPEARHYFGEVVSRSDAVNAMGEVIPRTEVLGESEEAALSRLLGDFQLSSDTQHGF